MDLQRILKGNEDTDVIVAELIQKKAWSLIKESLSDLMANEQKIIYTRKFFNSLIKKYITLSNDEMKLIGEYILEKCGNLNRSFFEEEIFKTKESLSDVYAAIGDFGLAAKVLADVKYNDQSSKFLTPKKKVEKYIQLAKLYFILEDYGRAGQYVDSCGPLMEEVEDDILKLEYQASFARHLDFNRKFLQAASQFYQLSINVQNKQVDESDILTLLNSATICAILGNAGPQRSRILAMLYKDERMRKLDIFEILEKMFMDRIIKKKDLEIFSSKLLKYHKAKISEDLNVLDRAMIEHNIIAVSKVYETISLQSLASLLEVSEDLTEKFLQKMIVEKRLVAKMDQLTGYIEFLGDDEINANWNDQIFKFCVDLNKFLENVAKKY